MNSSSSTFLRVKQREISRGAGGTTLAESRLVRIPNVRFLFLGVSVLSISIVVACSGSGTGGDSPALTGPEGGPGDSGTGGDATSTPDASDASTEPTTLSFTYAPQWAGVKSVDVIGGFGQATDWTSPLVSLTMNADGSFSGTSPPLPAGTYTYLFQIAGDSLAAPAKRDTYPRFAVDPTESAWVACPTGSPTYSKTVMNPCSEVMVPTAAATTTFHIKGEVDEAAAPVAGYLVVVERNEMGSHHQYVNRTTTGADGKYDLLVAAGTYRLEVLHPTFLSMTDAQRTDPATYAAVRQVLSSAITVTADVDVNTPDVSFTTYAAMTPTGNATLPTTLTFAVPDGAKSHAEIYGPTATIGDPWWTGTVGTGTSEIFDGGFNTGKADDGGIDPAKTYSWGVENVYAQPKNGTVSWTAQSMVFPIAWP